MDGDTDGYENNKIFGEKTVVSCSKFEREQQNNHHKFGFNMIYGNHPETV